MSNEDGKHNETEDAAKEALTRGSIREGQNDEPISILVGLLEGLRKPDGSLTLSSTTTDSVIRWIKESAKVNRELSELLKDSFALREQMLDRLARTEEEK